MYDTHTLEKMDSEILKIRVEHESELGLEWDCEDSLLIMVVNHRRFIHSNSTR